MAVSPGLYDRLLETTETIEPLLWEDAVPESARPELAVLAVYIREVLTKAHGEKDDD